VADHDERVTREREIALLFKQLWTHPAPERTTFQGRFVQVHELPFNPAPYQRPHPPIWIGGDSDATVALAKELGDGWVMLRSGTREALQSILSAPDWPQRPMTLVRNATIYVGRTHADAVEAATQAFQAGAGGPAPSLEAYLHNAILGSPSECVAQLEEMESWGINYVRLNFPSTAHQQQFAEHLLAQVATDAAT
jgi:alkanesulfonate monooxygenase SsuD/methylene tetrahydromethanopterin reductase-like flavin-dependent oxidoreductase (luciferase family)